MSRQEWSLVEGITNYMTRPRLGDPGPPYLWPSEASATTVDSQGKKHHYGKCRRAVFLRYAGEQVRFEPQRYRHVEKVVQEAHATKSEPDFYLRWIWKQ